MWFRRQRKCNTRYCPHLVCQQTLLKGRVPGVSFDVLAAPIGVSLCSCRSSWSSVKRSYATSNIYGHSLGMISFCCVKCFLTIAQRWLNLFLAVLFFLWTVFSYGSLLNNQESTLTEVCPVRPLQGTGRICRARTWDREGANGQTTSGYHQTDHYVGTSLTPQWSLR